MSPIQLVRCYDVSRLRSEIIYCSYR